MARIGRIRGGASRRGGTSRAARPRRTATRRTQPSRSSQPARATRSAQPSKPAQQAKPSQQAQPTKPSSSASAAGDKVQLDTQGAKEQGNQGAAKSVADNFLSGFNSLMGGEGNPLKTLGAATKSFEFDDKERKTAEQGLEALRKMAGKDGVLTPDDRGNIVGQMDDALRQEKNRTVSSIANQKIAQAKNDRGPLRKALFPNAPLVSRVGARKKAEAMRDPAHMQTARHQAHSQLTQGLKEMGMDTSAPSSLTQGRANAQGMPKISMQDTKNFESTMKMVQSKAKEMGLPEGKFEKGLPVQFLEDVLGGKPAYSLRKHQVNPFGQ